jgi:hypothetical protein
MTRPEQSYELGPEAPHIRLAQLAAGERDRPSGRSGWGAGSAAGPARPAAGPGRGRPGGGQAAQQGAAAEDLLAAPLLATARLTCLVRRWW